MNSCDDFWQIYSVTDGMGGAGVGDISSRFIQGFLCDLKKDFGYLDPLNFNFAEYIQGFIDHADQALRERLKRFSELPVGCSLALIMFAGDHCFTMSIGSCRIYLYREGQLFRMSKDHYLADDMESRPLLFFGNHPGTIYLKAHNLTQMVIQPDDLFLICSDGVTAALQDNDIRWILDKPAPLGTQVGSLFQTARRYDARDNQSILGIRVESRRIFSEPSSVQTHHFNPVYDRASYLESAQPRQVHLQRPTPPKDPGGEGRVSYQDTRPQPEAVRTMGEQADMAATRRMDLDFDRRYERELPFGYQNAAEDELEFKEAEVRRPHPAVKDYRSRPSGSSERKARDPYEKYYNKQYSLPDTFKRLVKENAATSILLVLLILLLIILFAFIL